jgi:hypothetical protein
MVLTTQPHPHTFSHGWSWDPERNIDFYQEQLAYSFNCSSTIESIRMKFGDCQPLANLITLLPGLVDVYYLCKDLQFPPCLLQALEEKQKFCRLHHYTFALASFGPEFSACDLALAKSPYLFSVGAVYAETDGYDERGRPSYVADAISSMVKESWLAPNLQDVRLFHRAAHARVSPRPGDQFRARSPWRGLPAGEELTDDCSGNRRKQALRHLDICGRHEHLDRTAEHPIPNRVIGAEVMNIWITNADFANLRVFRMGQMVSPAAALEPLVNLSFPNLNTLRFTCDERPGIEYYETVKGFILGLPVLVDLELQEWDFDTSTLADALSPDLTNLSLVTDVVFGGLPDGNETTQIVKRCQKLVDLLIPLRRSRGDVGEVAKYKTLGSLPRLRYLSLYLEVSLLPPIPAATGAPGQLDTPIEPHFDDFDRECAMAQRHEPDTAWPYRNGHLKDLLHNAALDEKLALAIFHAVSSGKSSGSLPLLELSVSTTGMTHQPCRLPGAASFQVFSREFGSLDQPITIMRKSTGGYRHELEVKQRDIGHWRPIIRQENINRHTPFAASFRRLWPEKEGSAHWWDDWESKPLAGYENQWADPLY